MAPNTRPDSTKAMYVPVPRSSSRNSSPRKMISSVDAAAAMKPISPMAPLTESMPWTL